MGTAVTLLMNGGADENEAKGVSSADRLTNPESAP